MREINEKRLLGSDGNPSSWHIRICLNKSNGLRLGDIKDYLKKHGIEYQSNKGLHKVLSTLEKNNVISIKKNTWPYLYHLNDDWKFESETNGIHFKERVLGKLRPGFWDTTMSEFYDKTEQNVEGFPKFVKALIEYYGFYVLFTLLEGPKASSNISKNKTKVDEEYEKRLSLWYKSALSLDESILTTSFHFQFIIFKRLAYLNEFKEEMPSEIITENGHLVIKKVKQPSEKSLIETMNDFRNALQELYPNAVKLAKEGQVETNKFSTFINETKKENPESQEFFEEVLNRLKGKRNTNSKINRNKIAK